MASAIGLAAGLVLLIVLTVRGVNIIVAGVACAFIVALTSGIPLLPQLAEEGGTDFVTAYMAGFTSFLATWFIMFLLGAIFGEVMAASGAADSVAHWVVKTFGVQHAVLAVVAACALLTYGGVSVFIVAFSVYPMALSLFRQGDLPRRFIPAALAFGSVTFTMTSAGSPEIQNVIPIAYLGTTSLAGWPVSLVVAVLMALAGQYWLMAMVGRAKARGERFDERDGDPEERDYDALPHPVLAVLPLLVVWGVFNGFDDRFEAYALILALGAGVIAALLVGAKSLAAMPEAFSAGAAGAVIAITNTCAVVGFGAVARETEAFAATILALQNLPGGPLVGAALAVTIVAGLTGSASGGQTIAFQAGVHTPYIEAGASPAELHRVIAIASGALDSLPHNGYVVTTIRAICGETHKDAYAPLGALTVVVPFVGLALAVALFVLF
ncbi:MAG: hypothetical protein MI723_09780 [Caulobacterales bacterium]|nr:hypothetical protein [Caulobacterales bacterium]